MLIAATLLRVHVVTASIAITVVVVVVDVVVRLVALVISAGLDAPLYHIPYPQSSSI